MYFLLILIVVMSVNYLMFKKKYLFSLGTFLPKIYTFSIISPLIEEYIFRYFLVWLMCHIPYYPIIITGLFGLIHIGNIAISDLYTVILQILMSFIVGAYLIFTINPDPETCIITLPELTYCWLIHGFLNGVAILCTTTLCTTTLSERPSIYTNYSCLHSKDDIWDTPQCKKCLIREIITKRPDMVRSFNLYNKMEIERAIRSVKKKLNILS